MLDHATAVISLGSFEFRVGKLYDYIISGKVTDAQRGALATNISTLLGDSLESPISLEDPSAKDLLIDAIAVQYPDVQDKLEAFLEKLEFQMKGSYPLKWDNVII